MSLINVDNVNQAAWIPEDSANLSVSEAPMYKPGKGEILIRNHSVAINPVDWKVQRRSHMEAFNQNVKKYPWILGADVSGVVEEVGEDVTRFKVGDRVISLLPFNVDPKHGGFQLYSIALEVLSSKIPDSISFDSAATIPLASATAVVGLFQYLKLQIPDDDFQSTTSSPKVVMIWGGSSSTGVYAIQLARLAGYKVISTASPHNFEYVKKAGAESVFDYNDIDTLRQIRIQYPKIDYALDAISILHTTQKVEALMQPEGGKIALNLVVEESRIHENIEVDVIDPWKIYTENDASLAKWFFGRFLEKALEKGVFVPNRMKFMGGGLNGIQAAFDFGHSEQISGEKMVVSLSS